MIKKFAINRSGRDFVVGDIHGQFTLLERALGEIGFNPETDRLFSVGDLVDRGPESEDCTEWLARPWFHAVRGNHEQMAIDAMQGYFDKRTYLANGGAWFMSLPREYQRFYSDAFEAMPVLIELEVHDPLWPTPQRVGLVHAGCPMDDWEDLKAQLTEEAKTPHSVSNYATLNCLWSRTRINSGERKAVAGIDKVISGHTPVEHPVVLGNSLFIDTAAWFTKSKTAAFTFIELPTWIIHSVSTHAVNQTTESHEHAAA